MEEKERKNEIKSEPKGYFNEERIYCIQQEDGTYETTEFPPNFDADGYYWKKQEDGQYVSTGLKYNEYGFRADRKHAVTKSYVDVRGFNIKGENIPNKGRMHDKKGFKQDGTYWRTGEKYHNGYNAYDVDIEGKKEMDK